MLRFDQLVHSRMSIREIRAQHPETISVFDELGFRSCCDDCSIAVAARREKLRPRPSSTDLIRRFSAKGIERYNDDASLSGARRALTRLPGTPGLA